jgi:Fe-S-cluster containining protein
VRVELGEPVDKYESTSPPDLDCAALFPICRARCCSLNFALTTQDLDEGVVKWDLGRPYLIRQSVETGRCVHQDVPTGRCGVYHHRPSICRTYDCRKDKRIWADFDRKIPGPYPDGKTHLPMAPLAAPPEADE